MRSVTGSPKCVFIQMFNADLFTLQAENQFNMYYKVMKNAGISFQQKVGQCLEKNLSDYK